MQVPPEAMSAALKWMGDNSLSSTALYFEEWAVHVVAAAFDALPDPGDFARDLNGAVRDDVSREHSAPSRQRLIETCKRATEPKATGMPDDFRALAHALLDWLEAGQ